MASNYKVKVRVEIEECAAPLTDAPRQEDVGVFEWVISAQQAQSIDECEQIVLQTDYEALRDALAHHLSAVSQQYVLEVAGTLEGCEVKPYRVDGEVGRITFDNYWVPPLDEGEEITARSVFPTLHAQEWYRTTGFKEVAFAYGTVEESYRQASALLNRVRHQEGATPARTLRENTESEGQQILAHLEQQATLILQAHGFTPEGVRIEAATDSPPPALETLPAEQVERALRACAPEPEWVTEMQANPVAYENATASAKVSLDDVCVKQQKASRKEPEEASQGRKRVYNTVAHMAQAGQTYILTGQGVAGVLRLVLAFLLHNQLVGCNLLFFVDGQRALYAAILSAFGGLISFQVILDWFHLEKRCKEQLSLALKGRGLRNALLDQLRPCLWHGCVDKAIAVLQAVDPTSVKDQKALAALIGYLERNRPYIPCYSVRRHLGLRNSSNAGEKANDLVVSERQKHNGMSWSKLGSAALAALTAVVRNQEYKQWFQTGTLSFSFGAAG